MINKILDYIIANPKIITDIFAYSIMAASIYVKLTPSIEDDKIFDKVLKAVSLYKK